MFIMGPLLFGRISVWIMIKNVLPSVFVLLKLVNPLLVLMHFEHVGWLEPHIETSRFRLVLIVTLAKFANHVRVLSVILKINLCD